jgi:predicted ATP-binding protein involved in virulence
LIPFVFIGELSNKMYLCSSQIKMSNMNQNFRIARLKINNIGVFGDLTLDFLEKPPAADKKAEIHILTGENGTGKSTILQLLTLIVASDADIPMMIPKLRYLDNRSQFEVTFGNGEKRNCQPNQNHTLRNKHFLLYNFWSSASSDKWKTAIFSVAFFAYSGYRRVSQTSNQGVQELILPPFYNVLNFDKSIEPQHILQWITNAITKESLAKSQGDTQIAQKYRATIAQLEMAISKIIEQPIRFFLGYEPIQVHIEVQGSRITFDDLPDGLKSIISWLSDLMMRMDRVKWVHDTPIFERNFILFLDEIEVHLHAAWQRKILPAVQSLFPNAQIFVSTHSPFVVGSVDDAWIYKLVKPNGDTILGGKPILSEDSRSVSHWLESVFDIKTIFGQAVEKQLDIFYNLRNALLAQNNLEKRSQFKQITHELLNQNSPELESIIGYELRQLNKRLKEPIVL